MNLIIPRTKPSISFKLPPLCNFRTSKAYLWALVRDNLCQLQKSSATPLNILDAACHSLITRDMFPDISQYYGLDISQIRLKAAFSIKRDDDYLFQADLCRPLPIKNFFDVVVSCNTLSHLPLEQQLLALDNLISTLKTGGSLFVNATICDKIFNLSEVLLNRFESVEIVYFDSFLSNRDESSGTITAHNVSSLIFKNEVNVLNDASLHSQVLFRCSNHLKNPYPSSNVVLNSDKIPVLNDLPVIVKTILGTDKEFLSSIVPGQIEWVLLTSRLASSSFGLKLIASLASIGVKIDILTMDLVVPSKISNVFILGLESQWISDERIARLSINRLREIDGLSIHFILTKARGAINHSQSFVINDF